MKNKVRKPCFACPEPGCDKVFDIEGNFASHLAKVHPSDKYKKLTIGSIASIARNPLKQWPI